MDNEKTENKNKWKKLYDEDGNLAYEGFASVEEPKQYGPIPQKNDPLHSSHKWSETGPE